MSLRKKTTSGMIWSFIDIIAKQGINFFIGIILARLLSPREFGLIGMTTFFITFSQSFIDSGFGQALVRKKNCTQDDYSTVFYYNLLTGIIFYIILFLSANQISIFFGEPKLKLIIQVLGIGLIIKSFTIIHMIILIKRINFKLQTKISVFSSIISGLIGIYLAYRGYGVWSLVIKTLSGFSITSILFWKWNSWKPSLVFNFNSFKNLFSFGSKLLVSGLIKRVYENIYLLIIGKYFSAVQLGFYTRADQFNQLIYKNLTMVVQRVSYPVLASIQDEKNRLKLAYQKLIKSTMLITFFLLIGLAAMAKPLILVLIGEKWLPSVLYTQMLCLVGIFFPLQEINQSMLKVQGRSDIILKLEFIKKLFVIPVIIVGILLGIKVLIIGMILMSLFSYIVDSYFAGKEIDYSSLQQIRDIIPAFLLTSGSGLFVYLLGYFLKVSPFILIIVQIIFYITIFWLMCIFFNIDEYYFIKQIIKKKKQV